MTQCLVTPIGAQGMRQYQTSDLRGTFLETALPENFHPLMDKNLNEIIFHFLISNNILI